MPMGLTNVLATFQRRNNTIFLEYLDVFIVVYLDDILIYSKTIEEHWEHMRKALEQCKINDITLNLEKCVFNSNRVEYLEHIIFDKGIEMSQDKVEVVKN